MEQEVQQVNFENFPIFSGLREEQKKLILDRSEKVNYKLNEVIFEEGSPGGMIYFISSGMVKIAKRIKEGHDRTLAVLKPGEFYGEMSIFDNTERSSAAIAIAESEQYRIPKTAFEGILEQAPDTGVMLMMKLIEVISLRVRKANELYKDLVEWGLNTNSIKMYIKNVIEDNQTVRVVLSNDRSIEGHLKNIEEGVGGTEYIIKDSANDEFVIPYHALQYMVTKGKKKAFF